MQFADVGGGRLACEESGSGPDTVFVHGIPTDYRAWNAQVPVFSKKYRVIMYSRRHAKPNNNTGSLLESTIENNALDLQGLIQKTTSPPINLIGHSYGGFIAAYVAANHPELVKRLVLIEPGITTLLIRDPDSRAQMLSLLIRAPSTAFAAGTYIRRYYNPLLKAYRKGDLETALEYFLDGLMNQTGALKQLPEAVQAMLRENAKTIGEVEAKLPSFTKQDARRISAPTLLVNGENGTRIFRAINRALAEFIPKNELVAIPKASHFPHFENPESFNEIVLEFLKRDL
jgi:pimeloyl-ACP methyl ester carboxylesterase